MRIAKLLLFFIILLLTFVFASCSGNIFEFTSVDIFRSDVELGDEALNEGDYGSALEYYKSAVNSDGENARARLGYIKALFLLKMPQIIMNVEDIVRDDFTLVKLLNWLNGSNSIHASNNAFLRTYNDDNIFKQVITYLEPIAEGKCDGSVSSKSLVVNSLLIFGYAVKLFAYFGDYNGDGIYCGMGDFIKITTSSNEPDGKIDFNPTVINFQEIATQLIDAGFLPASNTNKDYSDPSVLFEDFNANALDINILTPNNTLRVLIAFHETIEAAILVIKGAYEVTFTFDKMKNCLSRIENRYVSANDDMHSDFTNKFNLDGVESNKNELLATVEDFGSIMNNIHSNLIGSFAYNGSIVNYIATPISYHLSNFDMDNYGNYGLIGQLIYVTNKLAELQSTVFTNTQLQSIMSNLGITNLADISYSDITNLNFTNFSEDIISNFSNAFTEDQLDDLTNSLFAMFSNMDM